MLKYGQQLHDEHHFVRYVPQARLLRDQNDVVVGALPSAFELRPNEESLSGSWLEYFEGEFDAQVVACVQCNRRSDTLVVRKSSAFLVGNVRKIKEIGIQQTAGRALRLVFSPSQNNVAHSSIQKLPRDDFALFDLLAADGFPHLVMNASVPDEEALP